MNRRLKALTAHENIAIKKYNPINVLKPWELQALLHDKFFIVDGTYLLLGGRNLGDRYFKPEGYHGNFADDRDILVWNTGSSTDGSVLKEIDDYMESLWNTDFSKELKTKEDEKLILAMRDVIPRFYHQNPSHTKKTLEDFLVDTVATKGVYLFSNPINNGKKEPYLGYQLRELIHQANEKILIQTPYSTANKLFLEALEDAASKKEVSMVTNSPASTPNFPAFSNYYSQRKKFIATGVKLFEYQNTDSIHGKSIVLDDKISGVGSFNMDDRSLYLSTETMVIVESEEFAKTLTDAIEEYKSMSLEVGQDNVYIENLTVAEVPAHWSKRALLWIVSLFSRPFQFLI